MTHATYADAARHPQQVARLYLSSPEGARPFLADLGAAELRRAAAEIQFLRGVSGTWQTLQAIETELLSAVSPS